MKRYRSAPDHLDVYAGLGHFKAGSSDECWPWRGQIDPGGYGRMSAEMAHRVVYEALRGVIPDGLVIDHTCHTIDDSCDRGPGCQHRRCVNPDHMEPVLSAINSARQIKARKQQCASGHDFDAANTYIRPNGTRDCRVCIAARQARKRSRAQQAGGVSATATRSPINVAPLAVGQCPPCTDRALDTGRTDVDGTCHTDGCPAWCGCWDQS